MDSFTVNEQNVEVFERLIKQFEKILKTPESLALLNANQQVRLIRSFSIAQKKNLVNYSILDKLVIDIFDKIGDLEE